MNPYRQLRLDQGLTQQQVAKAAGVTTQVVLRTEQGLFASPSTKLTTALLRKPVQQAHQPTRPSFVGPNLTYPPIGPLSPSDALVRNYHIWQFAQRAYNGKHHPRLNTLRQYLNNTNHLIQWDYLRKSVLSLSVTALARLMLLQISLLQDLEKTGHNARQVSEILQTWDINTSNIDWRPVKVKHAYLPFDPIYGQVPTP